jgi:hypothetical protein
METIPAEIVVEISNWLDALSYGAFLLVNKSIYQNIFIEIPDTKLGDNACVINDDETFEPESGTLIYLLLEISIGWRFRYEYPKPISWFKRQLRCISIVNTSEYFYYLEGELFEGFDADEMPSFEYQPGDCNVLEDEIKINKVGRARFMRSLGKYNSPQHEPGKQLLLNLFANEYPKPEEFDPTEPFIVGVEFCRSFDDRNDVWVFQEGLNYDSDEN